LGPRFRQDIGIMFQSTALQDHITGRENLRMFGISTLALCQSPNWRTPAHWTNFIDRDTRKLSGGQRQRLLLAIALVNDPELLFLDEPTTGLDPQARRNFWELIHRIKARGKTLYCSRHITWKRLITCAMRSPSWIMAGSSPKGRLAICWRRILMMSCCNYRWRIFPTPAPTRLAHGDAGARYGGNSHPRCQRGYPELIGAEHLTGAAANPPAYFGGSVSGTDGTRTALMNFKRFWAVFVCRNLEFLRDRSALTWNLLFPVSLIAGFAFAFSGPGLDSYKVGVMGDASAWQGSEFFRPAISVHPSG
jgi:hypothetical protein